MSTMECLGRIGGQVICLYGWGRCLLQIRVSCNDLIKQLSIVCHNIGDVVTIFEATLVVDSIDRARRMKANFDDRPEVIYRGFTALMAGNVNFLFD